MRRSLLLSLALALVVTGCARITESRFNPLNWFGSSQPVAAPVDAQGNLRPLVPAGGVVVVDGRVPIERIDSLSVERMPGGALVRATGTASAQGQFNAQLVPVRASGGTLTLAFRVEIGPVQQAQGTAFSRQITVARAFTDAELSGIRRIEVQGRTNARVSSR